MTPCPTCGQVRYGIAFETPDIWREALEAIAQSTSPAARRIALAALQSAPTCGHGWNRDMEAAPRDGTVIEAVGRYQTATAGFPMHVFWFHEAWRQPCRDIGEPMVCWAWRPRDSGWPREPSRPSRTPETDEGEAT